jgi:hypothetical protein
MSDGKTKQALGFLTVIDHPEHGLFGGYLLLNLAGRPLEFHCTAPVRPNRAQEILYGPTLEAFLYGEQIGYTLLGQSKIEPLAVCTDREPALAVRELVSWPVALILPVEPSAPAESGSTTPTDAGPQPRFRLDAAHGAGASHLISFELGRNRLAVPTRSAEDRQCLVDRLGEVADSFDLAEPFARIREAIEEAQQGAR